MREEIHNAWERFINGENAALEVIFITSYQELYMVAFYYLKDEDKAKDVVAEVFKKMLELPPQVRQQKLADLPGKRLTFLKVITKNKCLDSLKQEKNRRQILSGTLALFTRSTTRSDFAEKDFKLLIDVLPLRQREVLEMHLDGYEHQEICDQLGISYNTLRNTLSTAKKKVRSLWKIFMD